MSNKELTKRQEAYEKGKGFERAVSEMFELYGIFHLHITTAIKRNIICRFCSRATFQTIPVEGAKGFPDFLCFFPGNRTVFFECKAGNDSYDAIQKITREIFEYMGFEYYLIVNADINKIKKIVEGKMVPGSMIQKVKELLSIRHEKIKKYKANRRGKRKK